jgi:DNA-directed RNA polymerase specialized sigma24 family protein
VRLLSEAVALCADSDELAGRQYGLVDDVEKFTNDVITQYLRKTGGYLRPDVRAELLAHLFVVALRCAEEYQPGRGWRFPTYVFRTCWNRITDWHRKRGGDRRYAPRPPEESLEERHELIADTRDAAVMALDQVQSIDTTGLTPESVMTIERIVKPMLELGLTKEQLEEAFGFQRRDLNRRLTQLRQELEQRKELAAA